MAAWLIVGWSGVVVASRIWLGMHWPVDVLASIGFAAVICALVYAVSKRFSGILWDS
ncbi:phosphatase PAP2 family protein [Enterovibrio nigricans]|uniref:phosphatase PAP2 family protein n=1 Tax=Enterovibrio nigricans TaxID=504469 RepID=UPI0012FEBB27